MWDEDKGDEEARCATSALGPCCRSLMPQRSQPAEWIEKTCVSSKHLMRTSRLNEGCFAKSEHTRSRPRRLDCAVRGVSVWLPKETDARRARLSGSVPCHSRLSEVQRSPVWSLLSSVLFLTGALAPDCSQSGVTFIPAHTLLAKPSMYHHAGGSNSRPLSLVGDDSFVTKTALGYSEKADSKEEEQPQARFQCDDRR